MKTRGIWMLVLLMWSLSAALHAQSYDRLWKQVEQWEKKDMPRSVVPEVQKVYDKAKAERNVPQMMKAYLTLMAWRGEISPDSIAVDVQGLEEWAADAQTQQPDRAVLYSILGEITLEKDFEKGNRYLALSLQDSLALSDYPAEKLVPMVKTGETSRLYFDNNLYDLLARRAVRLWTNTGRESVRPSIRQTWQTLLHLYKEKNLRSAWLLTALDAFPEADEVQLRKWADEYADLEVCAEVYLRWAMQMRYEQPVECLAVLREGIRRYPRYNRIGALINIEKEILRPSFSFSNPDLFPGRPIRIPIEYQNLTGFTSTVYRLDFSVDSLYLWDVRLKNVAEYGTVVKRQHQDLPPTSDYRSRRDTLELGALPVGVYYWVGTPDGHPDAEDGRMLHVTGLDLIHRALPADRQEVVVLDKQSGHPVPGAQLRIYTHKEGRYLLEKTYTADADGTVMLTDVKNRSLYWQARTETDSAMDITQTWLSRNRYEVSVKRQEHVNLFTDRAIYRPGQTLYFSGIAYSQLQDSVRATADSTYIVTLLDAGRKEVAKREVKTDSFGTFHGQFELPKSGRTGVYRLLTKRGATTFRVEEYKRPTFEVTFDTVRTAYHPSDSIRVTGVARTFAGAPVQGATVSYQVNRKENLYRGMWNMQHYRVTGKTVTDGQGRFEVPVHFQPIESDARSWFYTYEVSADVTSLSGETQTGTLDLPLGSSSLRLTIPDWGGAPFVKEMSRTLTFQVRNLLNVPIKTEVSYQVFSKDKQVWQGKAPSNEPFTPEALYALPSGSYRLKAEVTDEAGRKDEQTVDFTLLSLADKHLPEGVKVWGYQPSDEFDADGRATIYFGSCERDVYLFYDEMYGDNRIESRHITFSDSLMTFHYTYREEYGDGLRCYFAFMKDGELYVRNFYIKKPAPDKALQLKWKTFRDKLQPGQHETWTLSILRPDGTPADAQLMATLYDASLDRLDAHSWPFALHFNRRFPQTVWGHSDRYGGYMHFDFPLKYLKVSPLSYSSLEVPYRLYTDRQQVRMYKSRAPLNSAAVSESDEVFFEEEIIPLSSDASRGASSSPVPVRTNFAETAFFYPQLRTDASGEVSIRFTLPESLTEWRFMGLAHTRDMDYGSLTATARASKDFMLQPNFPRFVRVGDEVNVSASLINLSDKEVNGDVWLELFHPQTEKVYWKKKQRFLVTPSSTATVNFGFEVTDKYDTLAVRMVADGGTFSDGEQRALPVLTDKQWMTESVSLDVNGAGIYTFPLESLFNHHSTTVSRPQLVVEFTGNPVWYAVEALPVLANPDSRNALSWAVAYYANSLTRYLVRQHPSTADVVRTDSIDIRLREAEAQLKVLQNEDGTWSWFRGMSGSRYMTTWIAQLLARLQNLTAGQALDAEVATMYRRAMTNLAAETRREYEQMSKADRQEHFYPSEQVLQYLYICALDATAPVDKQVNSYFIDRLVSINRLGELTIYGKALGAIILHEAGHRAKAEEFLQSALQYSVMTDGMGRYFDTPRAHQSWFSYQIPSQVAVIEAVRLIANEEKTLDELKRWLLKQKQTQTWDNPLTSADAVYALLNTGTDWLANSSEAEIRVGKQMIHTPDTPSGAVRDTIEGKVTAIREVTVKKTSSGMGWGAVYACFQEDLDKVQSQSNGLSVVRTLYRDGRPLTEGEALQVGDRLTVCLTLTADRNMDFVQLTDERAACMEPQDALSGYRWKDGVGYYLEPKDASTSFFFDRLAKGTYTVSYEVLLNSAGTYRQGIVTARSVYAPEFGGHGAGGETVKVEN